MIKVILVPLDASERSAAVLDTALVVARRFDAHIKAVHVEDTSREPFLFAEVPASLRDQVVSMNRHVADTVADSVRDRFKRFCHENQVRVTRKPSGAKSVSASLHVLSGDPVTTLDRESRCVDVIAMCRPDLQRSGRLQIAAIHESLMLNSGRPVLIVPPDWTAHRADRAAVGWNESVEASRALALTLPWLVQMKKVTVLVSNKRVSRVDEVVDYLKRHGCKADHVSMKAGGSVGKKMLAHCQELGAEFLVVGGFSHTRTYQRLLGGVTSYLLGNTDRITVMAH